jgi:hypothetical protein
MSQTDLAHALHWHSSFKNLYLMPFASSHKHILHSHHRLLKVCNIHANMVTTAPWNNNKFAGRKEQVNMLLQDWLDQGYPSDFGDTEPTILLLTNISNGRPLCLWDRYSSFHRVLDFTFIPIISLPLIVYSIARLQSSHYY